MADTTNFTRFRGALLYANEGHRMSGLPIHVAQTVLGRTLNIGQHGVAYDFHDFGSEHWVYSKSADSGTIAAVQTNGASQEYGVLRMVGTATSGDKTELQLKGLSWRYRSNKKLWAGVRWKTDNAILTGMAFGLASTTTSFVAGAQAASLAPGVDDGIFMWKGATDTTWSFGTATQSGPNGDGPTRVQVNSTGLGGTIANDTYVELWIRGDENGNLHAYVDGSEVAQRLVGETSIPTDTELALTFGFRTGSAAVRTVQVDWALAFQDS